MGFKLTDPKSGKDQYYVMCVLPFASEISVSSLSCE